MAFAVEHHESPLPHDTLPPLHRRYPRSVLYVQTSPFISDTQEPIYSTNHGQTNSSRTSASRPVMQLTFPQDVRDPFRLPAPAPISCVINLVSKLTYLYFLVSFFGVDRVYRVWYHCCRKSVLPPSFTSLTLMPTLNSHSVIRT